MRRRLALLVLVLAALTTTACGGGGGSPTTSPPTPTATTTPTPTPTPTPSPVATPAALVVSVSTITLVDTAGAAMQSAPFSDGAGVVSLVSSATGTTPTPTTNEQYGTTGYDWGAISVVVSSGGGCSLSFGAPSLDSLALQADGGLAVGSSVDDAYAQGAETGDGTILRLEVTEVPGTTSLQSPGQTGVAFIGLVTDDGATISRILVPADDYSDL